MEQSRVAAMAMLSKGRSKQVLPDEDFLAPLDLRQASEQCAGGAFYENRQRKEASLKLLHMNDGRQVIFSREARSAIDPQILESIRCVQYFASAA